MLYMNVEYGNVLTFDEMLKEAMELYDVDDDTNIVSYNEYYVQVKDNYVQVKDTRCTSTLCDNWGSCPHSRGIHYNVWGEGIECKHNNELPWH